MEPSEISTARAELVAIDEERFNLHGRPIKALSIDERRWTVTLQDGRTIGFLAYMSKRRKALRDWLRKWGPGLKALGYSVVVHEQFPKIPIFTILKDRTSDADEIAAQLEYEKPKKFSNPNRQRSKRLGKRPEE